MDCEKTELKKFSEIENKGAPPMKVVYLINSLGAGGAEMHLLSKVKELKRRGHEPIVVALTKKSPGRAKHLHDDFAKAGAPIYYLDLIPLNVFGPWPRLLWILRKAAPDLIHSHLPRADIAAGIAKLFFPRMPWVCTLHAVYHQDNFRGSWVIPLAKYLWREADALIAVSPTVQKWAEGRLKIQAAKIRVIYHGVEKREESGIEEKRFSSLRIGCLSRFEKGKGIEVLIRAMELVRKEFPEAKLIVAGSDPSGYRHYLETLVHRLGLEKNVDITGFCDDPTHFLEGIGVYSSASFAEGFGLSLIEAMAAGLPVVASNIHPFNQIVENGKTGFLVDTGNHESFAFAILHLLAAPSKACQMGLLGKLRCDQEFSLKKCMDRTEQVYRAVLANRSNI